jgi:arylsulfatase A-like enzyme
MRCSSIFALFLPLVVGLAGFSCQTSSAAAPPNVVFILADDLGYSDLACYGSKYYETPNLDKLAKQGLRFTNAHTCGLNCQPTRAALMTGQYGPRTGIYTVGAIDRFDWQSRPLKPVDNVTQLDLKKQTVGECLLANGYKTGMFGKWHLGQDDAHHPSKQGFAEAILSQGKHFDFNTNPQTEYPKGQYLADFLTDKAVDFITRHKDEPFFLYVPHYGVHAPHEAKQELIAKFKNKPGVAGHDDPAYAAMIYSVDESVGRIIAKLDELKLSENTLVIFSSDNGGVGGYGELGTGKGITENIPLRGGKGMIYEGGHRVPFIARWPGKIPEGKETDKAIISVDLLPTLLDLTKSAPPKDQPLDGTSLLPLFVSGGQSGLPERAIFWHFPGYLGQGANAWRTTPASAIRSGDWKLIEFLEDGKLELYDLSSDIGEKKNLAKDQPEKAKALLAQLQTWRKEVNAPMPTKNTPSTDNATKGKGKAGKKKGKSAEDD